MAWPMLASVGVADAGIGGVDGGRLRFHGHDFGDGSDFEADIERCGGADEKFQMLANAGLETVRLDLDSVFTGKELGEDILTVAFGAGISRRPIGFVGDIDLGAGDARAAGIQNRAG